MSVTPSRMLALGTVAPDFTLWDTVSGKLKSLGELKSNLATVVMFLCNHCPYVQHLNEKLVEIAQYYMAQGIHFIAISSNDATQYPQDGPEAMQQHALEQRYPFPYLYDETQAVARAYQAACTPDFYVFDAQLKCIYRGQFDRSRPRGDRVMSPTGEDLARALDLALQGQQIPESEQRPSHGCNIKWRE